MDDLSLPYISCSAFQSLPNMTISKFPRFGQKSACAVRVHLPSVQRLGEGVLGVREETLFVRRKRPRKSLPRPVYIRAMLVASFRLLPRSSYFHMPLLPDVPLLCSKNALNRPKRRVRATSGHIFILYYRILLPYLALVYSRIILSRALLLFAVNFIYHAICRTLYALVQNLNQNLGLYQVIFYHSNRFSFILVPDARRWFIMLCLMLYAHDRGLYE